MDCLLCPFHQSGLNLNATVCRHECRAHQQVSQLCAEPLSGREPVDGDYLYDEGRHAGSFDLCVPSTGCREPCMSLPPLCLHWFVCASCWMLEQHGDTIQFYHVVSKGINILNISRSKRIYYMAPVSQEWWFLRKMILFTESCLYDEALRINRH